MTETDGRYFAWVKNVAPWIEPKLYPQIVIDTEIAKYLINHVNTQAKMEIVAKHVLKVEEYNLTINELVEKYPKPRGE